MLNFGSSYSHNSNDDLQLAGWVSPPKCCWCRELPPTGYPKNRYPGSDQTNPFQNIEPRLFVDFSRLLVLKTLYTLLEPHEKFFFKLKLNWLHCIASIYCIHFRQVLESFSGNTLTWSNTYWEAEQSSGKEGNRHRRPSQGCHGDLTSNLNNGNV